MIRRRVRLRPEYAEWYPEIWAGEWHDAAWTTEVVLRQLRDGSPAWGIDGRVLSGAHFEFEGGDFRSQEGGDRRRQIPVIRDPMDR